MLYDTLASTCDRVRGDTVGRMRLAVLSAAAMTVALMTGESANASTLYWDINGASANTGTSSSGAWDGTNQFWNDSSTGTGGATQAVTSAADDLFFSSGTNFTAASAVVVSNGPTLANGITFQQSGAVTLSGTAITLGGGVNPGLFFSNGTGANVVSTPIALASNAQITNNDNTAQFVSGAISGAFNLAVNANSSGSVVINGVNTGYSGITTIGTGTVQGRNSANTDVLTAFGTSGLVLNGGTLQLRANGTGNSKTIVAGNATTIGSSAVTIDVNNVSVNTGSAITLGSLSIGTGQLDVTGGNTYRLAFTGATSTLTGNATFNPTSANVSVSGAIGDADAGYGITKIGSGSLTLSGTSSFGGVVRINAGTLVLGANAPSGADGSLGNSTSAILLGDTSGSASATINEATVAVGRDIIVQSGNTGTMTLGSASQGNSSSSYSGSITLGSTGGTGKGLTLAPTSFHATNHSGVIQDPTGVVGAGGVLTISGGTSSSTITLSNANTYTGGTVLNTGSLRIGNLQALGFGPLTINGGAISQSAAGVLTGVTSQTWQGNFSFSATSGVINLGTSPVTLVGARMTSVDNGPATIGGAISGVGGSLRVNSTNFGGSLTLNGANSFDGGVTVAQVGTANMTVVAGNATALGTGQVRLTNAGGSRLSLNADLTVDSLTSGINAIPSITAGTGGTNGTYPLIFTGGGGTGAAGTATISGNAITAVSITDLGTNYTSAPVITLSGGGGTGSVSTTFGNSSVNLNPSVARVLTIAGTNASPATFAGVISGTNGALIKNGSGTQSLSGVNTYTGATTINGGVLNIDGSLASGSAVSVNNAGTLGGIGTVNGSVALAGGVTGATLASDATLTLASTLTASGLNNELASGAVSVAGLTTVNAGGAFAVNGTLGGAGNVSVAGTLSGSGTVNKAVTLTTTGVLSPGNSPGILTIGGDVTLAAGAVLESEINGLTAGTGYDQLLITGDNDVDLGGSTLQASMGLFAASASDKVYLISNSGTGTTTGQFALLADDAVVFTNINGFDWKITYDADVLGDSLDGGNDVALYAVPEPASLAFIAMSAAGLLGRRRRDRVA